jgi:hypothetical protein
MHETSPWIQPCSEGASASANVCPSKPSSTKPKPTGRRLKTSASERDLQDMDGQNVFQTRLAEISKRRGRSIFPPTSESTTRLGAAWEWHRPSILAQIVAESPSLPKRTLILFSRLGISPTASFVFLARRSLCRFGQGQFTLIVHISSRTGCSQVRRDSQGRRGLKKPD